MNNVVPLANDLNIITAEINSYKQVAGQSLFEIGKRLKHVKENDLAHGQFTGWLESVEISPRTAQAMMQAYEQFGNAQTSAVLSTGKIFEMLSLPESIDRAEFVQQGHVIPSTGEVKTVDEMTVKEIREVKKKLQEVEKEAEKARIEAAHFQKLWNQEKDKPPKVVREQVTIEKLPEDYDILRRDAAKLGQLNTENMQLTMANQQLQHKLNESKTAKTSIRSIKENYAELIKTLSAHHAAAMYELALVQGNLEAMQAVDAFAHQFDELVQKIFADIKLMTEIQKV
ncbi:DUF3102 domain-containing protein [Paenibacillus ginsengarvi]|uniref:DUF3102 domain-containing protein n=1 Tax=Paenibacillus ginsengarvi TaxID=400777 RepID=A0A3B0CM77_9BACL|nr:DUF3102 domain-containing protein [Paenibacillus ginsengarvi]RKN86785.1 DUF3102 domain-containing protein [Paenibacillus ginsengarvi]